jgi:hypothetical protein
VVCGCAVLKVCESNQDAMSSAKTEARKNVCDIVLSKVAWSSVEDCLRASTITFVYVGLVYLPFTYFPILE